MTANQYPETYVDLQRELQTWDDVTWLVYRHQIDIAVSVQGGFADDTETLASLSTDELDRYKINYQAANGSSLNDWQLTALMLMLDHLSSVPLDQRGPRSVFRQRMATLRSKMHLADLVGRRSKQS